MHRPQNQSKFCESNYHEDIPFFRETITIIDECTKLMKDDRIYLRNRIKDYLKELRENRIKEEEWENEQMQMLIQIFVEANKKKSLSKIQKGDKVMDSLQIKLRKFIDNNKKERHKKEVESFRKLKGLLPKKQNESHVYYERSLEKSREFPMYNAPKIMDQVNKFAFNLQSKKKSSVAKYSLGKSNQKSPADSRRKVSQNPSTSYSQHSFYKQFEYLRKASKSKDKEEAYNATASVLAKNKGNLPESKTSNHLSKFNKSGDVSRIINRSQEKKIEHFGHHQKKVEERLFKNNLLQEKTTSAQLSKHQLDKLSELFSQHLNSQEEKKISAFPTQNNYIFDRPKQARAQPLYTYNPNSIQKDISSINANMPSRYQASTSKIQEMMRNSKNILAQYQAKGNNLPKYQPEIVHPQPIRPAGNQDIFTPPDFLAECRKFIFSSSKKRSDEDIRDYQPSDDFRPKTFTDILNNQSKERSTQKVFKLNHYANQAVSEHVSANLSTNKPNSQVHFRLKNITISSAEDLLLELFKHSEKTRLDRFQISEVAAKCNFQTQKLLRQYCDHLDKESSVFRERLELDFVTAVKYFYTVGEIFQQNKDYFCNFICEILDIQKKDYVVQEDIQVFLESLASSQLDQATLKEIQDLLENIFKRSCEVQGGNLMTRWSVYYLQLKESASIASLREHLNKFQFQIDQAEPDHEEL